MWHTLTRAGYTGQKNVKMKQVYIVYPVGPKAIQHLESAEFIMGVYESVTVAIKERDEFIRGIDSTLTADDFNVVQMPVHSEASAFSGLQCMPIFAEVAEA